MYNRPPKTTRTTTPHDIRTQIQTKQTNTAHPQPDGLPPDGLGPARHLPNPGRRRPHLDDPDGSQNLVAPHGFAGADQRRGRAVVNMYGDGFWIVEVCVSVVHMIGDR